jgi:hypothetical protein
MRCLLVLFSLINFFRLIADVFINLVTPVMLRSYFGLDLSKLDIAIDYLWFNF